jgi:hypothetical protein
MRPPVANGNGGANCSKRKEGRKEDEGRKEGRQMRWRGNQAGRKEERKG